ncbi:MAG: hypothetical protein JWN73_2487 [Betaproteobacteria bacterium]|nr:hypothetical protein [Betaproteobacteria bacterium]
MSKELDELQELARSATQDALLDYESVPKEWKENLTLGTFFPDDEHRIFQLYVATERPSDAIIISTARVNRNTRLVDVTISNLKRKVPE